MRATKSGTNDERWWPEQRWKFGIQALVGPEAGGAQLVTIVTRLPAQKCATHSLDPVQRALAVLLQPDRAAQHASDWRFRAAHMSKSAAIAKVTGIASRPGSSPHALLDCEAVTELANHLLAAISSATHGRARPSRSACSQIALQVLIVAVGLRRAALVDALGLSPAQVLAISTRLAALAKRDGAAGNDDLNCIRLLYHEPTSQTFVVSARSSLWLDADALVGRTASPTLWVDARLTAEHTVPTTTKPDAHITGLIATIHEAVKRGHSCRMLVVSPTSHYPSGWESSSDAQLVGIALAGFLLEYGAVYCLHNMSPLDNPAQYGYDVRSITQIDEPMAEADFAASPANCLGSQPLVVLRVMWSAPNAQRLELLSFSVPQCLITNEGIEKLRQVFITTFQRRIESFSQTASSFVDKLKSGCISVDIETVTLSQVAL